ASISRLVWREITDAPFPLPTCLLSVWPFDGAGAPEGGGAASAALSSESEASTLSSDAPAEERVSCESLRGISNFGGNTSKGALGGMPAKPLGVIPAKGVACCVASKSARIRCQLRRTVRLL